MSRHQMIVRGETALCVLLKELDLEEGARLRKVFWDVAHQDGVRQLVVDLHRVDRLDPSAISLLVSTQSAVAKRKCSLILVGLQDHAHELLEQTHLDQYFEIRDRNEFTHIQS